MEATPLTARRPYLLRAIYEWLIDNNLTPHLLINLTIPGVIIPSEYIQGDQLILNISPDATMHLQLRNDQVSFNATFNGVVHNIVIPLPAVQAVYARENGVGATFDQEPAYEWENSKKEPKNQALHEAASSVDPHSPPEIRLVNSKKVKKKTKTDPDDNNPDPPRRSPKLELIK